MENVTRRFRVLTPSGVIADGEWARKEDIPAKIPDRAYWYFETEDAEIIEEVYNSKRLSWERIKT